MEPLYAQNEEEVLMNIIISNSSGKPIYEQITAQIKGMIMNGALKPGDPLPSMRLLAKELRISVITTKRAYEELERDGFISTIVLSGKQTGSLSGKKSSKPWKTICRQPWRRQGSAGWKKRKSLRF